MSDTLEGVLWIGFGLLFSPTIALLFWITINGVHPLAGVFPMVLWSVVGAVAVSSFYGLARGFSAVVE